MRGDWADLSAVPGIGSSWAHGGLAATPAGGVIGFHAGPLVTFDEQGLVGQVVATELVEGHGLTLVGEGQDVWLWVCDPGSRSSVAVARATRALPLCSGRVFVR